jgi:hypothetical protein
MTCAVDAVPDTVDAGATVTLRCAVSASPARDLQGQSVVIKDHGGETVVIAELTAFDGETNETSEFTVRAPVRAGSYTWSAAFPADGVGDGRHAEIATPFFLRVRPHMTSVNVWGVPSAVSVGEPFTVKVGIKCSSQCALTNHEVGIHDHENRQVARGTLGAAPWTGTDALYFREVDLLAPDTEGLFQWVVKVAEVAETDEALPHAAGSTAFGVRFVARPQHVVSVEVLDGVQQTPIAGARVVMHPYRAGTDEGGVAVMRVTAGPYRIFVAQTGYVTVCLPVDVTGNLSTRAELFLEPVIERD